ncbi:hypothetical protein H7198_06900, partial [Fructobacillus sp. CRL 2054]|uniref:hypothetical protein n=1 Tax=Fructobacillus sp. CRL 2054 TaxID=2763007 RepID=UPI0023795B2D
FDEGTPFADNDANNAPVEGNTTPEEDADASKAQDGDGVDNDVDDFDEGTPFADNDANNAPVEGNTTPEEDADASKAQDGDGVDND